MNPILPPHFTLLCPGPVNVDSCVSEAYSRCALSHREEEFSRLLQEVQQGLLSIAGLNEADGGLALVITGSGTAANEAVLASTVTADMTVIVPSNGEFGERLADISNIYNRTIQLRHEWGEDIDLQKLSALLDNHPRALVAMVHHETSTGLLNPITETGQLCEKHGAVFFVDAVSSFSADPVNIEQSRITYLSTSSGKALACYPGLSVVIAREKDLRECEHIHPRNHYLNLYRYYRANSICRQTPNTPATPLIASLAQSLSQIFKEGIENRHRRLESMADYLRQEFAARGLYQSPGKPQSVVLTNFALPAGFTFPHLQHRLIEHGFVIYSAKGPLQDRYFQVGTIGDITIEDLNRFFLKFDQIVLEKG